MSSPALEKFLARLYSDAALREQFLADPAEASMVAGLAQDGVAAMLHIDRAGLVLSADSFARKREAYQRRTRTPLDYVQTWMAKWNARK